MAPNAGPPALIPLCHPLALTKVNVPRSSPTRPLPGLRVRTLAKLTCKTGVEMEALTAASVTCLTIYDMAKAGTGAWRSAASGYWPSPAENPATGP